MAARILTTVVVVCCSIAALAETARWEARVPAPRPGLPGVGVILGEPGYVSTENSAIELHALAGGQPFDGYIGFHFEVGGNRTIDIPVVSRAILKPQQSWSFRTWVQLRESGWRENVSLNRELAIEWRDASMRVLAKRVVGKPPWSDKRPLRVVRNGEIVAGRCCLGVDAHVRTADELPSVAQWYGGFSDLIIATDVWLDLPMPVREAAFASGIRTVFVGPPRVDQKLTEIDRALVPVSFVNEPGAYVVPWPYPSAATRLTSPVSWRPKPETAIAGSEELPFLAAHARSFFVADASALVEPLPSMIPRTLWRSPGGPAVVRGRIAHFVREYRVAVTALAIALLSIALAIVMKRSVRVPVLVTAIMIPIVVLGCRDQLRPRSGAHVHEEWIPVAPGIVHHLTAIQEYGTTPIAERVLTPEQRRLSVSWQGNVRQEAEARTSDTAPGHGAMFLARDGGAWDSTSRSSARHEPGRPLNVTIRSMDHKSLTFDYEAPFAPTHARARWVWNGAFHFGDVRLDGRMRGRAVAEDRQFIPALRHVEPRTPIHAEVSILLIRKSRDRTAIAGWKDVRRPGSTWTQSGPLLLQSDGTARRSFVLPPIPPASSVSIAVHSLKPLKQVALVTAGSRSPLARPDGRIHYVVDPETVRRISPGGIVQVLVEPGEPLTETAYVTITVKEKRS